MRLSIRSTNQTGSRARFLFRFLAFTAAAALTIFLGGPSANAQSANIYLAQSALGSANGADCNDAYSYSFFNSSGNWGTGGAQIGPGTTVHLCGTFTGTPGQTLLTFQGSGNSGNPIKLLFEPGANLTAPYWAGNGTGAIVVNGKSWIVIDGGTNGVIQNSQDGTGLNYHQTSFGVYLHSISNVTVQNLSIINICQVTSSDTTGCEPTNISSTGVWVDGGASTVTITRNLIHDVAIGFFYGSSGGDNGLTFSYNTVYRVANSIQEYSGNNGTTSGFSLIGNDLSCVAGGTCNWADTGCTRHLENVHFYEGGGATYDGTIIANNYFHDMQGCTTGNLNLEAASGALTNFKVFNNVFSILTNYGMSTGSAGIRILNNTFTSTGPSSNAVPVEYIESTSTVENNIISNVTNTLAFVSGSHGNSVNYNSYYNWNGNNGWTANGTNYGTLAGWESASTASCPGGCDLVHNSIASNPNLNSSLVPISGSPVIAAGTNLTSLGISLLNSGAPQSFGVTYSCGTGCVPRPATGSWDMGAYQTGASRASGQPNPPTALTAAVQ